MTPMKKTVDKTHKFSVPNIIVSLGFCECVRGSSHHAFLSVVIELKQCRSQCKGGCVSLEFEWFRQIRCNQFRIITHGFLKHLYCEGLFLSPRPRSVILEKLCEGEGEFGKVSDKWSLIPNNTQELTYLLFILKDFGP